MAPGNHESAGKRKRGKTRKGRAGCARRWSPPPTRPGAPKENALGARYRALAARRGKKRAAVAVGHSILLITYHLLKDQTTYDDLKVRALPPQRPPSPDHLVHQVEALGFAVSLTPKAPAA